MAEESGLNSQISSGALTITYIRLRQSLVHLAVVGWFSQYILSCLKTVLTTGLPAATASVGVGN